MFKNIFYKQQTNNKDNKVISSIPVCLIRPNPYQPRKNFNIVALEKLCESIKTYGLLQPITIRQIQNGFYELVAGERRLRAAKIIGMQDIPSIIIEIDDNGSAILALIENSQREDLHFFEEAQAYNSLLVNHNITQEELSKKIGKSQSSISNKTRLLKLSKEIRKTIVENNLTEGHARALLKLHDNELQKKALNIILEKGLNVSKSEELIEKITQKIIGSKENKNKTLIGAYKDLRIFINTIKQTIQMMKKAGINAQASQNDNGEYYEFNIKVLKG